MLFKFLEKKLTLNCFVHEKYCHLIDLHPIQPAYKFYPEWMKSVEKTHFDQSSLQTKNTIRSCSGFINTFKSGYMIPMWSDLAINVDKVDNDFSYNYQFSDHKSSIDFHTNEQSGDFYKDHYILKLISPWYIDSCSDVKFLFTDCMWNNVSSPGYITPTGITNLHEKLNTSTNIFIMLKKQKQKLFIHAGQPMMHIIPLTERKTQLKFEILNDGEFTRFMRFGTHTTFNRHGVNRKRNFEGKCPIKTTLKNG